MAKPKNVMEVFKYLDKSNCKACGEKTCLAFAGAVFQSRKQINDCPRADEKVIALFAHERSNDDTDMGDDYIDDLKAKVPSIDLADVGRRYNGNYDGSKLTLKMLGRDFGITRDGEFTTQMHVNRFVAVPFLELVAKGQGLEPAGEWVSFRELKETAGFSYDFFHGRCEVGMRRVADNYPDLFEDLVGIFGGQEAENQFGADIAVILYPLPKVPIMVCYWKPEDDIASDLNLYFDKTADYNLPGRGIYTICYGMAKMIENLSIRHAAFV